MNKGKSTDELTKDATLLTMKQSRKILLLTVGGILFAAGIAAVWLASPTFFAGAESTDRVQKIILFIAGCLIAVLGWNFLSDASEKIYFDTRKMVIKRSLRADLVFPVGHIKKVRLRRRHIFNPLRGIPGKRALQCYIEAREGAHITRLEGNPNEDQFIAYCREHDLLKEGSEEEYTWYREGT